MKKLSLVLMLIFAANALAGIHVEDFATPEWTSEDWVQFATDTDTGVVGDLDYMPETPNTSIRASYDWHKGNTTMGGNPLRDECAWMLTGNAPQDEISWQEIYLQGSAANPVRWESTDVLGYGDAVPANNQIPVTISLIASDSTVLYTVDITPESGSYTSLNFGSVPYDTSMTLRIEDQAATGQNKMAHGFLAFDQLAWSEVPEPVSIVLLGLGTLLLRKRR